MWLPVDAERAPVPALLEYLPYRKGDLTSIDDSTRHPWFAGHGYASLRVDLRGTGDSDGVLLDEYSEQEQEDALEVVAWLAEQPWCNGRVGMLGISWGGFNALQVAARRPPALRAIVTCCSTDDRHRDDVHYKGGFVLARDMLGWATTLLGLAVLPPDPAVFGPGWRDAWDGRLRETPAFIDTWLGHPTRDEYWKRGSVCEDFSAIQCPVLVVGGLGDGYTNAFFRLLEGLAAPARGILGPWAHQWPQVGNPGPAIGFLQECLRWWDEWLKGEPTGVLREPRLRVWIDRWLGVEDVPERVALPLTRVSKDGRVPFDLLHGNASGAWCPFGPADLAAEQGDEDRRCLLFETPPLDEALDVLGFPDVKLAVDADRPRAQLVVRLCDVAPDGASRLVSWGVAPVEGGGGAEAVRLRLDALGHRFAAGHRVRLAVASCYWPMLWPEPEVVALRVRTEQPEISLPTPSADQGRVRFGEPECAAPIAFEVLRKPSRRVTRSDREPRAWRLEQDAGRVRLRGGIETDGGSIDECSIEAGRPETAVVRCQRTFALERGAWRTRVEVESRMRRDDDAYVVEAQLEAFEDDRSCHRREFSFRIGREGA